MACFRRHRSYRRSWLVILLTLLIALQSATPAWAWGRLGHRVISRLAKKHMTEKARDALAELLDPNETIADASLWADENRRRLPKTAPWHYVDVPLDEPAYDAKWSADDPKKGCVVDKINEFRKVVKDKSKPVEERRFALRFLIHCIEDMHMPLHVGDNHDRGGNDTQVRYFDRGTNMQSLWDGGMIERVSTDEEYWLKGLTSLSSPQNPRDVPAGTVEDWGHGVSAGRQGSLPGPSNGRADQVGDEAWARLPQQEHPEGQGENVPGRHQAGEGVE